MADGPVSTLDFMRARSEWAFRQTPRHVLAFYYTWYGAVGEDGRGKHWGKVDAAAQDIEASTNYPVGGAYDSHDPAVIDRHIHQARACGIDTFISTWWGRDTFDDQAFALLLDRAALADFHATIYWERAPGEGEEQIRAAVRDMLYVLRKYAAHDAFLKLDGKPVIFVYGRVMGQAPTGSWPEIISEIEASYGSEVVFIADGYQESYARLLDGVHTYNICGWVQKNSPEELRTLARERFEASVGLARGLGKISCLTVIPGYDDTKIRTPGTDAERHDGQTYRVLWEEAIAADPDWMLITSWNEWHEGSEIEPSVEHGDKYLRLTREYATRFAAQPPVPQDRADGAGVSPEMAAAMRELYRGRTIGILPAYGGQAPFWLADVGVDLRELTWDDVVAPEVLTPDALPVILYAAHERYRQTVNEAGDVDAAIQRYLRAGGLMVVMSNGPFPFYYNEDGKAVRSAGRMGLPMEGAGEWLQPGIADRETIGGWERPPEGVTLRFDVDTDALPGLPETADFPATGDVRWRPATVGMTAPGDEYQPLATLRDEAGRSYGDGICLVRHVASEPVGGTLIYVWMRMADVLDRDELMAAVFRLAGETD
jgi:hypothetical protein